MGCGEASLARLVVSEHERHFAVLVFGEEVAIVRPAVVPLVWSHFLTRDRVHGLHVVVVVHPFGMARLQTCRKRVTSFPPPPQTHTSFL